MENLLELEREFENSVNGIKRPIVLDYSEHNKRVERANKQLQRDVRRAEREERNNIIRTKRILKAGNEYNKENKKVNLISDKIKFDVIERERKPYEQGIFNNTFNVNSFMDERILNITVGDIITPNNNFIMNRIESILTKRREDVDKKFQINSYITIKYLLERNRIDTFYFNSKPRVITSKNLIRQYAFEVLTEFYEQLTIVQNGGSGGIFKGIIKFSIKTALSKAILGKSYIELP